MFTRPLDYVPERPKAPKWSAVPCCTDGEHTAWFVMEMDKFIESVWKSEHGARERVADLTFGGAKTLPHEPTRKL